MKKYLLVMACLNWAPLPAFAQPSTASQASKWEIEVHAGGVRNGNPTDATTAMPPAGEPFTTRNDRPSRYVSSWYFGDGTVLVNQLTTAFPTLTFANRLTPLDPVLTGSAASFSDSGSFGLRLGRRLSPRFAAELNVDYNPLALELSDSALGDVEASRATFERLWNELVGPTTSFRNGLVSSSSVIEEGSGGQVVATGAVRMDLRRNGSLIPYVTGGLGGVFNHGRAPTVTLNGNYSMGFVFNLGGQVPPGALVSYNEVDAVTVRFVRPERALVGVVGGGFRYDLSRRHGLRIDLRLHVTPYAVDTEVSATPLVRTGTPAAMIASNTTPTVQFSNTGSGATLSGPPITAFKTREGLGVQINTALTAGYFWRF